jgi:2,4-dienoyl-CoA reductase (NADPH2)
MGRALIADPQFPMKAEAGQPEKIRPCVGFAQDCRQSQGGVTCGVNASAGREVAWSVFAEPERVGGGRVTIVGGGPGGMEAARVAALLGHEVTLYEKHDILGGQLRLAARTPHRSEFNGYLAFLEDAIRSAGVDLRLGVSPTADEILAGSPDLVVLATGSVPQSIDVERPADAVPVFDTWQVLRGEELALRERVLLVDDGTGFWEVCGAADYLVAAGLKVDFITPNPTIGRSIPHESLPLLHRRLRSAGTSYSTFTKLVSVGARGAVVTDVFSGESREIDVDSVVLQVPNRSVFDLAGELAGRVPVERIGDSVSPRRLTYATLDANRVIRALATRLESRERTNA